MTIKELREKKNNIAAQIEQLIGDVEQRELPELTEDEAKRMNELSKALTATSNLLKIKERVADETNIEPAQKNHSNRDCDGEGEGSDGDNDCDEDERAENEKRAFELFIRRGREALETRDATNMTFGENGAVIPQTIAKKVIKTLENICPIYEMATKYHFKGEVSFPVIDEGEDTVVCDFADEFSELISHVNSFSKITLSGYLAGALALISRSLINNSQIDVVDVVIMQMAVAAKRFLEESCLVGRTGKTEGVLNTENVVTTESATAITADDLIDLQSKIIDQYQENSVFIMHPTTRNIIRKLKDSDGNYIFNSDITTGFKPMVLGKPVHISDKMPTIAAGQKAVYYGDPSGLYVNIRENITVDVLREKYATMHAIGVNMWLEIDNKIVEVQKHAVLKLADGQDDTPDVDQNEIIEGES